MMFHIVNFTLKDLKLPQRPRKIEVVKRDSNKKNKLKGGSKHEVGGNNEKYLDEDLHNNNL